MRSLLALASAPAFACVLLDPTFALSKPEQGHPLWGPVYKRVQP